MSDRTVEEMAATLSLLLHQKLGVRGGGLEAKLARAGRRLPARIRRRATEIVEAGRLEASPKLARRTDPEALARAFGEVQRHLMKIDATDRRRGAVLGFLGSVALISLAVFGLVVTVLVWRGYL